MLQIKVVDITVALCVKNIKILAFFWHAVFQI